MQDDAGGNNDAASPSRELQVRQAQRGAVRCVARCPYRAHPPRTPAPPQALEAEVARWRSEAERLQTALDAAGSGALDAAGSGAPTTVHNGRNTGVYELNMAESPVHVGNRRSAGAGGGASDDDASDAGRDHRSDDNGVGNQDDGGEFVVPGFTDHDPSGASDLASGASDLDDLDDLADGDGDNGDDASGSAQGNGGSVGDSDGGADDMPPRVVPAVARLAAQEAPGGLRRVDTGEDSLMGSQSDGDDGAAGGDHDDGADDADVGVDVVSARQAARAPIVFQVWHGARCAWHWHGGWR